MVHSSQRGRASWVSAVPSRCWVALGRSRDAMSGYLKMRIGALQKDENLCGRKAVAAARLLVLLTLVALAAGCGGGSATSQKPQGPGGVPVKIQVVTSMPVS